MDKSEIENFDDNKCILVEFPNENGNLAVGYVVWLTTVTNDDQVIALIKSGEQVTIR